MRKLILPLAGVLAFALLPGCRKEEPTAKQAPPAETKAPPAETEAPKEPPAPTPNPPEAKSLPPGERTAVRPFDSEKWPMPLPKTSGIPDLAVSHVSRLEWGDLKIRFASWTNGWPDAIAYRSKPIGEKTPGQGLVLNLLKPSADDDGLAEQSAVGELVASSARSIAVHATMEHMSTRGELYTGDATSDFEVDLENKAPRVLVTYTLTWRGKPDALVASHGIRIPFAFGDNPRRTKAVAGADGRPRGEIWWVDQNDLWHIYWMLSDQKERWPLWRLGGICQDSPDHYFIWKANRADTCPVVVDQGKTSPGWLDVSDTDRGVTVVWEEMPKRAPCAITVNWPEKMIEVWFHPPSAGARSAESLGLAPGKPVTWKFSLCYHDDVFPATQRQEIPRDVYVEFLRLIDEQKLWQYIAFNTQAQFAGDLDTRIRQAIDSGVQPSEILRYFDTGNTWKMQKLCAAVGARYTNDHAANMKAVLDWCTRKAEERKAALPVK